MGNIRKIGFIVFAAGFVLSGCGRARTEIRLPSLEVVRPLNQASVASSSVILEGKTDQESVVVNGIRIPTPAGVLIYEYPLDRGSNPIDISAGNESGTTTVRLEVIRQ